MVFSVRALVQNSWSDIGLEQSRTDGEHVKTEGKWSNGSTVLDKLRNGSNDHDNVSNTADRNTDANGLETTKMLIGKPSSENWKCICKKGERVCHR